MRWRYLSMYAQRLSIANTVQRRQPQHASCIAHCLVDGAFCSRSAVQTTCLCSCQGYITYIAASHIIPDALAGSAGSALQLASSLCSCQGCVQCAGRPEFEHYARRALQRLWTMRTPLGLFGTSLDMVHGVWLDNNGGIGASADSFYEYLLKAYILFGEPFPATPVQPSRSMCCFAV